MSMAAVDARPRLRRGNIPFRAMKNLKKDKNDDKEHTLSHALEQMVLTGSLRLVFETYR